MTIKKVNWPALYYYPWKAKAVSILASMTFWNEILSDSRSGAASTMAPSPTTSGTECRRSRVAQSDHCPASPNALHSTCTLTPPPSLWWHWCDQGRVLFWWETTQLYNFLQRAPHKRRERRNGRRPEGRSWGKPRQAESRGWTEPKTKITSWFKNLLILSWHPSKKKVQWSITKVSQVFGFQSPIISQS